MSIFSHRTIADSYTQADGRRRIYHEFTDHLGNVITTSPQKVESGWTETEYSAERTAKIAGIELQQAMQEVMQALSVAEQGNNPDRVPEYQTQAEFDRRLLGKLMATEDVYTFHAAQPFWAAVQARGGANANQRALYLGVSRANYDLIANRFGDDQGAAFFLDNAKGQVWRDIPQEFE